jgi:cobalt-zinc-cadmium efflux system outer membrane protein
MKIISVGALVVLVGAIALAAEAQAPPSPAENAVPLTPAYVNRLVEEMRTNHPALRAVGSRLRAAQFATNAVRTWEDPVISFGGVAASSRGPMLDTEGDLLYGLEQKLPLFGKPGAARRVAQAETEVAVARLEYQFQILRRELVRALFKAALAERVVEVGVRDLAWLEALAATTEERYRAGVASQVELLRVQNERSQRADQLLTDTNRLDQERLVVNRLLNRDLRSPSPDLLLPAVAGAVSFSASLAELAVEFEPKLRVMQREIEQAVASVAATRKARLPEVGARIQGRQYSGDGAFRSGAFMVSLSLPWFNGGRYRDELARDRARLEATELEAADYQLSVREGVRRIALDLDAARREAVLYRDEIIPRSRQSIESAYANWLASRGLFSDVMEARRMLLDAELTEARAVALQYETMADLVLQCGLADFDALERIARPPERIPPPNLKP